MTTLDRSPDNMTPDERRALLAQLLQEKARSTRTTAPLSQGQAALWFTHAMAPESSAYNVAFSAAVRSPVNVAAMGQAFQALVDRHPALRTTFIQAPDGKPQQVIAGAADLDFVQVDAAGWDDDQLHERVASAYRLPFDLEHGPLLRVFLFTRGPSDHVLLVALHHIVFDGWSMGILLDEFQTLYRAECAGTAASLPPLQHTYTDFVTWQHALLSGPEGQSQREYWHRKLSGALPLLELATDRPRPAVQTLRGASQELRLSRSLVQRLRALAKAEHTTLYSVLLTGFYVLLLRHSGQDDLIVGTPMVGRTRAEFQRTIGYFVSPVALRADLSGQPSFRALLAQVRQTVLEALENQDYPFARLVEELQPLRSPGRSPIIEALFNVQQVQRLGQLADRMMAHVGSLGNGAGQLDLEPFSISQEEGQFDVNLNIFDAGDDVFGVVQYNPDLFDEVTMVRMGGHYLQLLESIVAEPAAPIGALPMLTATELQQLASWNVADAAYPTESCLHDLIAAQAERTPASIAVHYNGEDMTYSELDRRSNQLAHTLRQRGVGPGVLVGVCTERSFEMVIALLATLKAGGAYVPIDPSNPAQRIAYVLGDASVRLLLTQTRLRDVQPPLEGTMLLLDADWDTISLEPEYALEPIATPEDLAYVIYTSGSTGKPKGVMITHHNLVYSTSARFSFYNEQPGRFLLLSSFAFDSSVAGIFWTLCAGGALVLPRQRQEADVTALAELIEKQQVTHTLCLPSLYNLLLDFASPQQLASLQVVCVAGETCTRELTRKHALRLSATALYNEYGPTEGTVWSTAYRIPLDIGANTVPIGRPIPNAHNYILDSYGHPTPIGVAGELTIGGEGVAPGYLGKPELTAQRFVTLDLGAGPVRVYRTGDLARYRPDGMIEYLGRADGQVKVRGFRIELGEIEVALTRFARVREAAVAIHPDARGSQRLVAYLVVDEGPRPGAGELRSFLKTTLPDYMIPSAFVFLDKLPLNANGKMDRRALLPPDAVQARGDERFAPPTTPTEQAIATVWRDVLNLDRVSIYDNFFDLGGHSLIAVEALARLNQQLGVKLGPADIRLQTLGQLAAMYDQLLSQPAELAQQPTQAPAEDGTGSVSRLSGAVRRIVVRKSARAGGTS